MPRVQYIGRPSLHFYGKYLWEIVANLKCRGTGRMVVKETEANKYPEPCFYVIDRAVPLLSDTSHVRCRVWARRIFRGRDLGTVYLENTHEPDWRLVPMDEAEQLLASAESKQKVAPDIPVRCVAPMPPLLALYLRSHARFPKSTVNSAAKANPETLPPTMREANGFLLLTKVFEDPTTLQVPIPPTPEEQARIHPPYSVASEGGLVAKRQVDRDSYFIRRSDSRGIYWKVITTKDPPPISQQLISSSSDVPKP